MIRPLIALLALGFAAATLAQQAPTPLVPTQQAAPPAAAKPPAKAAQAPKKIRPAWAELDARAAGSAFRPLSPNGTSSTATAG
jgi:hypothetical protein